MKINKGYLYVSLASILWASVAAVSKLLFVKLDNFQLLFFITLFSFITLFVISVAQGKISIIKSYKLKDYLTFALMGFIGIFLYRFFFQAALLRMTAQEAYIVNYTWPIFVVIFAWIILKEKIEWRKTVGLILAFLGVVVVITKGNFSELSFSLSGSIFALLGAVVYGLYSAMGKKQTYEKYTSTTFFFLFAFIFSTITLFMFSSIPSLTLGQIVGLLWLGIFTSGLGFVFWLLALKYGDTAKISSIILITPFLSLVFIYFMLGEKILISSIIGLFIIVAGILIQSFSTKKLLDNSLEEKK